MAVSDGKAEAVHLWSVPSSAETTLHVEMAGQLYKQMAEFVGIGGAVRRRYFIRIACRISPAWAHLQRYRSHLYNTIYPMLKYG